MLPEATMTFLLVSLVTLAGLALAFSAGMEFLVAVANDFKTWEIERE